MATNGMITGKLFIGYPENLCAPPVGLIDSISCFTRFTDIKYHLKILIFLFFIIYFLWSTILIWTVPDGVDFLKSFTVKGNPY